MIPQYNASKTMRHTDVKQLLLRNLLLVGLRHKDVLKQCQTMKSNACTAEHLLNLARQKCHTKGHFEKVCRQDSTRKINKQQPVHKLEDDDDEEEEEEEEDDDVTSVYSFKILYNLKAMESEHIRPLWISTTATSQVHKVNVEVDTGADCNMLCQCTCSQKSLEANSQSPAMPEYKLMEGCQ